ncbi:hypothetical protein [Thiocystis violacea]|uniref:hypothetical protein n=1 Tax=Thiocystis violacea TaxID=13725 RepID=UPI001905B555|nr:hypothetical protein [Thiocystis violacea]MBK1720118.1 hypothetical protein [Thiocystis violacea]
MKSTSASLRALRTVAHFSTGVASGHARSDFAQLPGYPRLRLAAHRIIRSHALEPATTSVLGRPIHPVSKSW